MVFVCLFSWKVLSPIASFQATLALGLGYLQLVKVQKVCVRAGASWKKCQEIHRLDTDPLLSVLGYCEGVKWRPLQASPARAQGPERLWPCPTFKPFCLMCRRSKATEITIIMLHHAVPINKCVFFSFQLSPMLKEKWSLENKPQKTMKFSCICPKAKTLMFCYFQLVYTKRIF